jgi:hypothetical protein
MKKVFTKIFKACIVVFLLLQFYQPARNKDDGPISSIHFTKVYNVPVEVKSILQTSCYDCHSNKTNYPWYSYIQPARMLMESHIKEGKKNVNFSEWGNYSTRKQGSKLESIEKQVKKNTMPLKSYTLMHQNARLNDAQRKLLLDFIKSIQ